ncbi:MAG TPA: metal-dependent transcriptional regulator [Candidatus Anaerostipes excrementavium]|uniref:Metal-dependent transcriptional regulator n=1 Tax=Candidatus Anaerostipes excrementavium TaxID=2838463 RepID=A0A9D1WVA6_9FIRM|nr:metal-dependent transcriptional regulator [uncultured Anaerostipes sp.]HIX67701.1 metal-dependent transcriptional regulator [Candidatus Anaerostipes excrementavium]
MKIQESAENYLETILVLGQAQNTVRSIDIVHKLNFSKPSVSVAMKNLRQKGLIIMDSDGHIALTESGRQIAETIYERHTVLSKMLIDLGVDPEIAADDACRMEHVISPESFAAIKQHLEQRQPKDSE